MKPSAQLPVATVTAAADEKKQRRGLGDPFHPAARSESAPFFVDLVVQVIDTYYQTFFAVLDGRRIAP